MALDRDLSFNEWVDYVFHRPISNPAWHWLQDERGDYLDWWEPDGMVLIEYLTRLFEEPGFLVERYSPEQLDQGFWYILGIGSEYLRVLDDHSVATEAKLRLVRSFSTLYSKLFARVCTGLPIGDEDGHPLDSACFMWWDMDAIGFREDLPERRSIDNAQLEVLRDALQLPSAACISSAIHGLGEAYASYSSEVEDIIDEFLDGNSNLDEATTNFALQARRGLIQ